MKSEMQIFSNSTFGNIRTIEEDGKVLFCAKDIAKSLGYIDTTNAIKSHCKGVAKRHLPTDSGIQELNVIPEGDVYRLITHSKLPSAEKFERWLFDEVVPSVVHTGSYGQAAMDMKMLTQVATAVCAEMIKQLLPLINSKQQAETQQEMATDTIEFLDEPRRKRKQFSVISKLSVDIRQEVEEMLCSGNYSYTDIVNYLATKGIKLSIMSVSRYAHRNGCYEE